MLLDAPPASTPKPRLPAAQAAFISPPVALLGVPFDSLTVSQSLDVIEKMIASGRPHQIVTANVDFLAQASRDPELRRILVEADLALCDGMPLVWASRWLGNPLPERVAGADLVPRLLNIAAAKGYRIFLLGGKPEVAAGAAANLQKQFPGLIIADHYSPPFLPLAQMPHGEIICRIKAAKPHIVLVSFGCPKAEKWISMHLRSLEAPVAIGVGGTIDFLAGRLKRAPLWMQRNGMEWLFRLLQEPRRLAARYGNDFRFFSGAILRQWWTMQRPYFRASHLPLAAAVVVEPTWERIRVPQRFDREALVRAPQIWEAIGQRHCLLELANVKLIDSTAIALLLRLNKKLGRENRQLVLLEPSPAVLRALKLIDANHFLLIARDTLEARQLIQARTPEPPSPLRPAFRSYWDKAA